ncbi:DNA/RNA nuclease SfsA [Hydrogenimonas cancrithermarum]|uniref:Sugar fermentation stimulation protein homolog n=1 Tax=Hydrogenimonas cancrithermarum TaxID=2993563 RepID=A0ABM8FMS2_9BACT|nr:DNA/RNA nuclease SfsA [Hydrogenimonas cancrithermarum]BDY13685.1 sugar fermentation stimulation protein [Hydrogenimonas cancrithermarum]
MPEIGDILYDLSTLGEPVTGQFSHRLNRFVALAEVAGEKVRVHVADTGRLEEILTPGRTLWLLKNRPGMKTAYTLLAARMEEGWVLVNTRLHAPVARRAIELGVLGFVPHTVRNEVRFGDSRFDYLADDTFVELKGCSLVQRSHCRFPNAPTTRGVRHLRELMAAKAAGHGAILLIMALRPCDCFEPHPERDEAFRHTFYEALENGVEFRGFFVRIENRQLLYDGELRQCETDRPIPV